MNIQNNKKVISHEQFEYEIEKEYVQLVRQSHKPESEETWQEAREYVNSKYETLS